MKKLSILLSLLLLGLSSCSTRKGLEKDAYGIAENMVYVEGGSFMMGSDKGDSDEKPIHKVEVGNFYISKYEVTQAQWQAIMGENPSNHKNCPNCPVERVSWEDCQEFIKRLNLKTGKKYRLPTEAEWAYASRGGKYSKGYKYAGSNDIDKVAWYGNNSDYQTHVVGKKEPNELGLYDMSGNVWEWCSDWYGEDYYGKSQLSNPEGPTNGEYRVLRGGSWNYFAVFCRTSYRCFSYPSSRSNSIGLRLLCLS